MALITRFLELYGCCENLRLLFVEQYLKAMDFGLHGSAPRVETAIVGLTSIIAFSYFGGFGIDHPAIGSF